MRTRIKICGLTRKEDGLDAAQLGADAIGLVFYEKSPRFVSLDKARAIVAALPPFICKVGLFVDASVEEVNNILTHVRLDLLQFHGEESPAYCRQFGIPYIKALRMQDGINVEDFAKEYCEATGLLLDTYQQGVAGGTGQVFDWTRVPKGISLPVILAGGLTAENVADAIRQVKPYAVDVSGGVEITKGVKDAARIAAFMNEVKRVTN